MHTPQLLQRISPWIDRWSGLIAAPGDVLDVACGSGRHSRHFAGLGHRVCCIDRDAATLAGLHDIAGVEIVVADLEGGIWPLRDRRFSGIVVTNYLHRPLFGRLLDALTEDGVLIYETFAAGNERFGRPSNPDFLLRPGELIDAVRGRLKIIAYEDVCISDPAPAMVQRICAAGPAHQLSVPDAR